MIGYSIINKIIEAALATNLVSEFYHTVDIIENRAGGWQPQAKVKGDWTYVGPDDQKGLFAYIRQSGNIETLTNMKSASCDKSYMLKIPHRVVFFSDNEERNFDDLIGKLISFTFISGVDLTKILTNKRLLLQQEAPDSKFNFIENTFYFGVDFTIREYLSGGACEQVIRCVSEENPICKI